MGTRNIYRIAFANRGNIYELYARKVSQSTLYAFVEVEDIIFGERSTVVVDPSEERLKSEFAGVKRTYIPLHAVLRIDEVEKEGPNKIHTVSTDKDKVRPFPMPMYTPGGDSSSS